jgi:GNAT superfamily N-acetyltransferase
MADRGLGSFRSRLQRNAAGEATARPGMETRVLLPPSWVELAPLISASREEGYLFLVQLEHEYLSGKVRFDATGETLLGVFEGSELVGLGAITRDLDSTIQRTGRVRHVYVLPEYRRRGFGKALLKAIERLTRPHFTSLVLRTGGVAAESFFLRVGYEPVSSEGTVTHRRLLVSRKARRQTETAITKYIGKCRVGIKARNLLTGIQVVDAGGNSIPLSLSDYLARGVKPDYATLPWCEDLGNARPEGPAPRELHTLPKIPEAVANGCRCKIISASENRSLSPYHIEKCPVHG